MGLKRAFEASVQIKATGGYKSILTRGDVTFEESYTEIEVKNAAADEVRYLRGMNATTFSMTVQAGDDPEDSESFDAYAALLAHNEAGTTFTLKFTSPGGFTKEKNFIITNWQDADPVDGLNEATITFRVSADDVATS